MRSFSELYPRSSAPTATVPLAQAPLTPAVQLKEQPEAESNCTGIVPAASASSRSLTLLRSKVFIPKILQSAVTCFQDLTADRRA